MRGGIRDGTGDGTRDGTRDGIGGIRLNKLLAERVGLARRKCDEAIARGEVVVDGAVVVTPGVSVDPKRQRVLWRGEPLPAAPALHYLLLHKPLGVLVTWRDPQGRRTIRDCVPPGLPRLFAVGRLDSDTSGLLLLTNDGALAHRLAHPRYEVPKTYRLTLAATPTAHQLGRLEGGVDLGPGERTAPARASVVGRSRAGVVLELTIAEGKNRQVRRMCEAVGLTLRALERVAFGPLALGSLRPGRTRALAPAEVRSLVAATRSRPGSGTRSESGTRGPRRGVRKIGRRR